MQTALLAITAASTLFIAGFFAWLLIVNKIEERRERSHDHPDA